MILSHVNYAMDTPTAYIISPILSVSPVLFPVLPFNLLFLSSNALAGQDRPHQSFQEEVAVTLALFLTELDAS